MAKSKNKITAIYVRVSTARQAEEGYSVPAQVERLTYYCKAQGWNNIKEYVDGGFSGSKLERPKIQELIEDSNRGKISRVVVFKLDRLSRSQKDTLYLITNTNNLTVPNVVGLSSKVASSLLKELGIKVNLEGVGYVTSQSIQEGTPIIDGLEINLTLSPKYQT